MMISIRFLFAALVALIGFSAADAADVPDFRHVQVQNPARLSDTETSKIYDAIKQRQFDAFARSGLSIAEDFPAWRIFNSAPFLSSTHGNRFISHYANDLVADYGRLQDGNRMPKGAAFAKDSFIVEADGTVRAGRLFIMEKMAPGSRPATADWRYAVVDSDGTVLGDNAAVPDPRVEFCHTCHKVREDQDYLFFVPSQYRNGN